MQGSANHALGDALQTVHGESRDMSGDAGTLLQRADAVLAAEPDAGSPCWVARAPGRLDVMGGIAEYTGALVVAMPLIAGVAVTAATRIDREIVIYGVGETFPGGQSPVVVYPEQLFDAEGVVESATLLASLGDRIPQALAPAVGAIHVLAMVGKIEDIANGLTIIVDTDLPVTSDFGTDAALSVASLMAVAKAWGLSLDPVECAHLAQRCINDFLAVPCGIASALCALHGTSNSLSRINCERHETLPAMPMPDGITLLGIDCRAKDPLANLKYVRTRTAALMGRRFVKATFDAADGLAGKWNGSLARLSCEDFRTLHRVRIPIKIKGCDFLNRFGPLSDPYAHIEPDYTYRPRSRTEHHVYEAERTVRFTDSLCRTDTANNGEALTEAGRLMQGSHWSYGQRCGLGSVETEKLVKLIYEHGSQRGVYGARVSGHGSGGVVTVLLRNDDDARRALLDAAHAYHDATQLEPVIHEGTSDGALRFGVHSNL